jgi:hypothetical protein
MLGDTCEALGTGPIRRPAASRCTSAPDEQWKAGAEDEMRDEILIRETVGVFQDQENFQSAIDDLLSSGFDRADLRFLASRTAVEEKLGHAYRTVRELEDEPAVPRVAYVSTESIGDAKGGVAAALIYIGAVATAGAVFASGGTVAAAIATAVAAGAGGAALGMLLDRHIEDRYLQRMEEQLARGGLLLWVNTRDAEHQTRAVEILTQNRAEDVHVHDLSVAAEAAADMKRWMSELVDEAGRESFPASDAAAFVPGKAGCPRRSPWSPPAAPGRLRHSRRQLRRAAEPVLSVAGIRNGPDPDRCALTATVVAPEVECSEGRVYFTKHEN